MRVVQATRFGGPEVLVTNEIPDPVAGPGEVVVGVSVVDTVFLDIHLRRGGAHPWFTMQPPYVPGMGVAGQVISVGEGVDAGWVGRRVVSRTGRDGDDPERIGVPIGGYAAQAVAPERELFPVPDGLGLREAAPLLSDGLTALFLAEAALVRSGEWVLITPAGGGLGSLLVQLARAAGGRVVGAARGGRKLDLAREVGAEAVVDYSREDWQEQVRETTDGKGVDVALDGVGGQIGRAAFEVTAGGGRFFAYGAPSGAFAEIDPLEAQQRGVRVATLVGLLEQGLTPDVERQLTERALSEAVAGRIRPIIGQTFPLEQAADAHAAIEARQVIGKTLLLT